MPEYGDLGNVRGFGGAGNVLFLDLGARCTKFKYIELYT